MERANATEKSEAFRGAQHTEKSADGPTGETQVYLQGTQEAHRWSVQTRPRKAKLFEVRSMPDTRGENYV